MLPLFTKPDKQKFVAGYSYKPIHEKVDAHSAAWVPSQHVTNRVALGKPEVNDAIWLPKLNSLPSFKVFNKFEAPDLKNSKLIKPNKKQIDTIANNHQRLCPACEDHVFKRWPFGWDAHAAYICNGVKGDDIETKKFEIKKRFL